MIPGNAQDTTYDLVVIGSGFGSLFFVEGVRRRFPSWRILILERGSVHEHAWQIAEGRNSSVVPGSTYRAPQGHARWNFTIAWGGGMNCWWAQAPRLHPSDFALHGRYGVGADWPLTYAELEPWYCEAESIMAVAGDQDITAQLPRSKPFPMPMHGLSSADRIMKSAQPERHFGMPTARRSMASDGRAACCSTGRCHLCPVDAKFSAHHHFGSLGDDPRVDIVLEAEAWTLESEPAGVEAVRYRKDGRELLARGSLFALGANAIQSSAILLRSGMDYPGTGEGIHEQLGCDVEVDLDGLDHFDGGTVTTGLNYGAYDGAFRRDGGSALIYFENRWKHGLRAEPGRWRQVLPLTITVEDLPDPRHRVLIDRDGMPTVTEYAASGYARRGMDLAIQALPRVLEPLPVERIRRLGFRPTESHLQGGLRMGRDPGTSVCDAHQRHHRYRNLLLLGSAVFPSCSAANPSLTVAALSLRAAAGL